MKIKKRRLGRTGQYVTIFGLGGEGLLRSNGKDEEAARLINEAIDLGVNYLETARAYSGSEGYYGKALKPRRPSVFLAGKTHARDKAGALKQLEESLRNLKTDYLDLWQIHDVRTEDDIKAIFGPNGAIEALVKAREDGKARFLGVTGHHDPVVLRRCIEAFDFDTVLMPVNPAEPHHRPFLDEIIPLASRQDMGVIAMKVYMKNMVDIPKKLLFSYALTQPVTTAVIGCDSVEQLKENVEIAENYQSVRPREMAHVARLISPHARELQFYKG